MIFKFRFIFIAVVLLALSFSGSAHPVSQGALDVTVGPADVTIRARVTLEEIIVSDSLNPGPRPTTKSKNVLDELTGRHARYLTEHLSLSADGKLLTGRVVALESTPITTQPATQPLGPDQQHVVCVLAYALPVERPKVVQVWQDVFVTPPGAEGTRWEASYVVNVRTHIGPVTPALLLTSSEPLKYNCDWTAISATNSAAATESPAKWRLVGDYLAHGVHHILSGYDHLLFITALVLAATSVWDLVKVVTAFTLAHTITLTLAALQLVSLPTWIVEPMIAASIVFVAAQNVFWPSHARGWGRLAIAFGFGLFHGLGFAGGLLDAMSEMSGLTITLAIAAFSIGVELGHQVVVIPLYGALYFARRTRTEPLQRDRLSHLTLRYGSAMICCAGAYYFVSAVSSAITMNSRL